MPGTKYYVILDEESKQIQYGKVENYSGDSQRIGGCKCKEKVEMLIKWY